MDSVTVNSLSDFIKHNESQSSKSVLSLFRGQPINGNLLPGIARKNPDVDTTSSERALLQQIRLQGASFLANPNESDLDLLVRVQHYGLQTRLLDWTSNPLVALWFACSDKRSDEDVYVYALDTGFISTEDELDFDPFSQSQTKIYQPKMNNSRIIAQHGWFTLHRYSNKAKRFISLEKNSEIKSYLSEFLIPAKSRKKIVKSLDRHGINNKTLFPDLSGLCEHLNWANKLR